MSPEIISLIALVINGVIVPLVVSHGRKMDRILENQLSVERRLSFIEGKLSVNPRTDRTGDNRALPDHP
jgi:hypothetical protein